MDSDWSYTCSWSANREAVARARGFARDCLSRHARNQAVDDVVLVVSELVTNAVVHARTPFSLTLASHQGRLSLTVRDTASTVANHSNADPFAPGGRGLRVVEALSSVWGADSDVDGGKSVWAVFDGNAQHANVRTAGAGAGEAGLPAASSTSPPVTA